MIFGMGWIAKLALGGLLKIGVSEGAAGKLASSKAFGAVLLIGLGAFGWWAGGGILKHYVARVSAAAAKTATAQCVDQHKLAAALSREKSLKDALRVAEATRRNSESAKGDLEKSLAALGAENEELRNAGKNPDRLCVDPDDPWVRGKRPRAP